MSDLKISRSSFYYQPQKASAETLAIMNRMDELFMQYPFYGSRQMAVSLQREGVSIGRHRVRRLMRIMGLQAIYRAPKTSAPHPEHKIYPYLLRNVPITTADHVWCSDITYIPMQKG
ncbi:MAG: IS3 family transposase, partial [Kordiimonadaceae bacterium]|nr:IS3 family transposase [Kordiimonadaceae bacterium]